VSVDRLTFPARIEDNRLHDAEDWGYTVAFRDLAEAITHGASVGEAEKRAAECLWTAVAHRMMAGESIPPPSQPAPDERLVTVDDLLAPKAVLYSCLRERRLTTGDLSRRLNIKEQEAAALATRVETAHRAPRTGPGGGR
jgi:predicted RNase H-like HicB family nuclease